MSVIEPALQVLQAASLVEPVASTNLPALQPMQAATFDAVEYVPVGHRAHVLAPVLGPVFVIEPAPHGRHKFSASAPLVVRYLPAVQSVQAATFDAVEYLPVTQGVHADAPAAVPVFVIEPARHVIQFASVAPARLYEPASQAPSHWFVVDPPAPKRPAAQFAHAASPLLYLPAGHEVQPLVASKWDPPAHFALQQLIMIL